MKTDLTVQTDQNTSSATWCKMVQHGSQWCKMVQYKQDKTEVRADVLNPMDDVHKMQCVQYQSRANTSLMFLLVRSKLSLFS